MTASERPKDRPADVRIGAIPDIDLFSGLTGTEQTALATRCELRTLRRADVLVHQGDAADALYVVISGRFAVTREGHRATLSEIGRGQPVGEMAFLMGGVRTATVTAMRDSLVLALSRDDFDELVAHHPGIWRTLTATLARRLAETTSNAAIISSAAAPRPRTICLVPAGGAAINGDFVVGLARALRAGGRTAVLSGIAARNLLGDGDTLDGPDAISKLNALEAGHDHVLFIADDEITPWTEKAVRHADLVLAVARHEDDPDPSSVELFAARFVAPEATRLVLLHPSRQKIRDTARWLSNRTVAMHHHVALDRMDDIDRLVRFIEGRALGFIAAGGGALAAAHTGVFKALTETGLCFDVMGGTSAGAALSAAFLLDASPEEIDARMGEMFVANRAMRRYTLPRYGLLDHTVFDEQLRRLFGETDIEDLWLPFFAVSTNLTRYGLSCHRRGPLWRAIRASSSIPVMLPPVYTADGDMLVDGCLLDNVPVKVMHDLKAGPNIVVSFKPPELQRFEVDYDALPSRSELLRLVLNPLRREPLPGAPGLLTVLTRALMANRRDYVSELAADDVLLVPPLPAGMGFLDWHRHSELFGDAYRWTKSELDLRRSAGCPAWLAAVLADASVAAER